MQMLVTILCALVIITVYLINTKSFQDKFKQSSIWKKKSVFDEINQKVPSSPFAIDSYVVIDNDNKILAVNDITRNVLGWRTEELLRHKIDKIILPDFLNNFNKVKNNVASKVSIELEGKSKNEDLFYFEVSIIRWPDEPYYTIILRDVSHRKRNEAVIKNAESQLALLRKIYHEGEKAGNVAFWQFDCLTGELQASPNYWNLYGIKGLTLDMPGIIRRVLAEDKIDLAEAIAKAQKNNTGYEIEYRVSGLDGYINTFHSCAIGVKCADGGMTHLIGMDRLIKKEKPTYL